MGRKRDQQIFELIKQRQPKSILEIGTWNGQNAVKMTLLARKYNREATYTGIDVFEDLKQEDIKKEAAYKPPFTYNDVFSKLTSRLISGFRLYKGLSCDILPKMSFEESFDFIYIDGGHSVETIKEDWNYAQTMINPNGYVVFDDYFDTAEIGCRKVIEGIGPFWKVTILPIMDVYEPPHYIKESRHVLVEKASAQSPDNPS